MNYRLFQPGDFPPLYAIEGACFMPPLRFGRRYMRELIESPTSATWIAEEEGCLVGFAIVDWTIENDETIAYIQTIEVSPTHRRRGIGLQILKCVEASAIGAGASSVWLHVDAENAPAISLYGAHGYLLQGRHANYYARGRPAEIYARSLSQTCATGGV